LLKKSYKNRFRLCDISYKCIRFDVVAPFHPMVVDEGKAVLPYFPFYLSISYYLTVNH